MRPTSSMVRRNNPSITKIPSRYTQRYKSSPYFFHNFKTVSPLTHTKPVVILQRRHSQYLLHVNSNSSYYCTRRSPSQYQYITRPFIFTLPRTDRFRIRKFSTMDNDNKFKRLTYTSLIIKIYYGLCLASFLYLLLAFVYIIALVVCDVYYNLNLEEAFKLLGEDKEDQFNDLINKITKSTFFNMYKDAILRDFCYRWIISSNHRRCWTHN